MKNETRIMITLDEMKDVIGKDYSKFYENILGNCYCVNCKNNYNSRIINYKIFLNELDDLIIEGYCDVCGGKVNRYVETGENEEYIPYIRLIREKHYN